MAESAPYINDALDLSCPCGQILLDLIDEILEDRRQAEIKQEKLKKRRALRTLLADRLTRSFIFSSSNWLTSITVI